MISLFGKRRGSGRIERALVAIALTFAFLSGLSVQALAAAGNTGTLTGTVTAADTKAPLAGAQITAAAPSGRYTTHSDARGFFSFTGVTPDTYTVSIAAAGYDTVDVAGVTVFADQQQQVSQTLTKSLTSIGSTRTTSRSAGTAFQPAQTNDTYTVTSSQIDNILGKKFGTDEVALIASLPGVTFDNTGYPTLRGGRVTEEGFQFEGIDYTDAFLSQFVNTLSLAGQGSLQLTPGAGDASSGNTGTGIINLIAKRGTYPSFGTLDLEVGGHGYNHQLGFEYGAATPNGRFSDYTTFVGQRTVFSYGPGGTDVPFLNRFYSRRYQALDNFVNNFVYRFGRDNNQSLQFFTQVQNNEFFYGRGGFENLYYKTNDPYTLANFRAIGGSLTGVPFTNGDIQNIVSLYPGQMFINQKLPRGGLFDSQPNGTYKFQYNNNLNPSTFFDLKYYKVNAVTQFAPQVDNGPSYFFDAIDSQQGGLRTGFSGDLTKQFGAKHLIQVGGKFENLTPVFDYPDPLTGLLAVASNFQIYDFLGPNNATCQTAFGGPGVCGYLSQFFPQYGSAAAIAGGADVGYVPVPQYLQGASTHRHDYAAYIQDTWSPNDNLKINYGLRLDGVRYGFPSFSAGGYAVPGGYSGMFLPTSTGLFQSGPNAGLPDPSQDRFDYDSQALNPRVLEPKIALSFRMGRNDAIRASYARSVQFAPIGFVDTSLRRTSFQPFLGIPAGGITANAQGQVFSCGPTGDRLCKDYADQLFWANQTGIAGFAYTPVKPETFSNWEFSYEHQFKGNVGLKITPFYRRGYDALVQTASQKIINGVAQFDATGAPVLNPSVSSSAGTNRTTGVEFYVTKDAEYGLSGSLSATYINEFSNIPPTQTGEDFLPTIPIASLKLGNQYRVGYLSPFQFTLAPAYRFRSGFKITPNVQYNMGYPIGSGQIAQILLNGTAYNVPNTNLTNSAQLNGPQGTQYYVDPQKPGSVFNPNIVANRGTPDGPSPGSVLSTQSLTANIAFEYSPPKRAGRFTHTIGVKVDNIFNNYYNDVPALNVLYQPLAVGYGGPKTGLSSNPIAFPLEGFSLPSAQAYRYSAYTNYPRGVGRSFLVYYQIGL